MHHELLQHRLELGAVPVSTNSTGVERRNSKRTDATDSHWTHAMLGVDQKPKMAAASATVYPITTCAQHCHG